MLILTRKPGEAITATNTETKENVEFTVLGVKGNQVRIGISAPMHINVARNELLERTTVNKDENWGNK